MSIYDDVESLETLPEGRILAVDYGSKRIGLAMSDPSQFLASTLETLQNDKQTMARLKAVIEEHAVQLVVVGKPLHMNGTAGESAEKAAKLAERISQNSNLPVVMWDERWTTKSAETLYRETGRSASRQRNKIDQVAAAYLLQSFLDRLGGLQQRRQQTQKDR